jgi:hypothetical protein
VAKDAPVGFRAPEVEQMILQVAPGEGVERGERLVQQQHFRLRHQRARNRDPLRLPAGQFARPGIGLVGKADPRQRARDLLAPRAAGRSDRGRSRYCRRR